MIYVDPLFVHPSLEAQANRAGRKHGHQWSHMWCDIGEEDKLDRIAKKIGMKPEWRQNKPGFIHYDLVPTKRAKALTLGVVEMSLRDWLKKNPRETRIKQ